MRVLDEESFPFSADEAVEALSLVATREEALAFWVGLQEDYDQSLTSLNRESSRPAIVGRFQPSIYPSEELLALLWHVSTSCRSRVQRVVRGSQLARRKQILHEARILCAHDKRVEAIRFMRDALHSAHAENHSWHDALLNATESIERFGAHEGKKRGSSAAD